MARDTATSLMVEYLWKFILKRLFVLAPLMIL